MTTTLTTAQSVAHALTSWGFGICIPAWEGAVNLKITSSRGALSELTISSTGHLTWDYHSFNGRHASAAHLISVVLDLLDPDWEDDSVAVRLPVVPDLTLQGLISRALIESGMRVTHRQPESGQQFFGSFADIIVNNPAEPGRGTVRVADHGAICWEIQVRETAGGSGGFGINEIALTIGKALARTQQPCCLV